MKIFFSFVIKLDFVNINLNKIKKIILKLLSLLNIDEKTVTDRIILEWK